MLFTAAKMLRGCVLLLTPVRICVCVDPEGSFTLYDDFPYVDFF